MGGGSVGDSGTRIREDPRLRDRIGVFHDREEAGRLLAPLVSGIPDLTNPIIAPIPAGGVAVGVPLALALRAPLRLAVVRKIQIPWNPEAGFGAVTWDGRVFLNQDLLPRLGLSREEVEEAIARTRAGIRERMEKFTGNRETPVYRGRDTVIIDDGLASGYTMRAAVDAIRREAPRRVLVVVPTGSLSAVHWVAASADLVLCANIRTGSSFAVADAYREWHDLGDAEVLELLWQATEAGLF
ncbi:MAG: phosphoribosyltransferase [Methanomicrobiales archaeon]|nr:phosphoribosyltransferase [Methanomicrobiales archaeon]